MLNDAAEEGERAVSAVNMWGCLIVKNDGLPLVGRDWSTLEIFASAHPSRHQLNLMSGH